MLTWDKESTSHSARYHSGQWQPGKMSQSLQVESFHNLYHSTLTLSSHGFLHPFYSLTANELVEGDIIILVIAWAILNRTGDVQQRAGFGVQALLNRTLRAFLVFATRVGIASRCTEDWCPLHWHMVMQGSQTKQIRQASFVASFGVHRSWLDLWAKASWGVRLSTFQWIFVQTSPLSTSYGFVTSFL